MQVLVHVNVELTENANQEYLKQGQNVLRFLYTYSTRIDQWLITSVSTVETEPDETEANDSGETATESVKSSAAQ